MLSIIQSLWTCSDHDWKATIIFSALYLTAGAVVLTLITIGIMAYRML